MSASKRILGGRYELDGTLGEGGMATVYQAVDTVLGRSVAVKVLSPRYVDDDTFVERFRREAQAAAAMNHPNIVNVYDTGSGDGTHYIVMELVEGRSLRDVIEQDGPLLPERAAEIAEAVAAALAFAHERGIVHRDVKPGNVMITPSGDVKVMDFGIARAMSGEALTQTSTVLGTATYLSPEQAQGEPVDARSDIYSLGVVLYEMLTKTVPFEGDSPVSVAYKHVREEPVRPSEINRDVPEPLERVVLKAMAKNPDNRYGSAQEIRQDLARFLAGRPVEATPLLPPEHTEVITRRARDTMVIPAGAVAAEGQRSGLRTAGIVALVLVILAGLGALFFFLANNIIGKEPQATVPNCVNNTIAGCTQLLEDRGLKVGTITRVPDAAAAPNTVLSQDPPSGDQVDKGTAVDLTVSRGKPKVPVPNVVDLTEAEARQALIDKGFQPLVDHQPNPDVADGIVFDQDPDAGKKADEGSSVQITVSTGPETVQVPNLSGMTVDEARTALEDVGLVLGDVAEGFCVPPQEAGTVCTQDPPAGQEVDAGTSVNVIVMSGEPSPSPSTSPTDTPTP